MIMRTNNSFETIITNKSIGVEIETFKETNSKGEIEVYEKSKLKKLISHTKELINDQLSRELTLDQVFQETGLWTLRLTKTVTSTESNIDISFESVTSQPTNKLQRPLCLSYDASAFNKLVQFFKTE